MSNKCACTWNLGLSRWKIDRKCRKKIGQELISWQCSENINPLGGPQLKHELFCGTNPAKFWWIRFLTVLCGAQNQQNVTGFVPQNNSCPGFDSEIIQILLGLCSSFDHHGLSGFVLQFKLCPVHWELTQIESLRSWVRIPIRPTSPNHFLMAKTRFKLQHKSSKF